MGLTTAHASIAAQLATLLVVVLLVLLLARKHAAATRPVVVDDTSAEERLLQLVARSRLLAGMIVGKDGRIHAASDAVLGLVGHDREALARERLRWDALAPVAWQDLERLVRDASLPDRLAGGEGELVHADGNRVPVRIEVTRLDAVDDRYLVLVADLSAGPLVAEELARVRTELERHQVLFDSTPVGLFAKEYRGEKPGRYILSNPMTMRIVGRPDMVSHTDYELFPPEVAAMVQANDHRVMADGVPVIAEEWVPDAAVGEMRCFLSTKVPLLDAAGKTYGIGATAQDITPLKLLTERLAAMVGAIPDTLIRIDAAGRILDVENRNDFLEGTRQELIGTVLWERITSAEARQQLMETTRQVRETGRLQELEQCQGMPGGERCYEARLVTSGKDEIVVLVRDITEAVRIRAALQEANVRMQAANEALREFAYVASHDLQEPLRTASSFAELLERTYRDAFDEKGRRWLRTMLGGIQRMRALIDDVLAYAQVGRIDRFEPVDTAAVVRAVLEDIRASVESAGAEIQVGDLPAVVANEVELKQVFQNLLSNALKFRRADVTPRVGITARPAENGWLFAVADNGIGIEPAYHERIFQMFQRLHSREEFPGTGIGLALVKRIIERHGGTVCVSSTPGQGTEFRFTIPVLNTSDGETSTTPAA